MSHLAVYLITRLTILNVALGTVIGVCFSVVIAFALARSEEDDVDKRESYLKIIKRCVVTAIVCLILGVLTPTTKEACVIYVLPKIANSEIVSEMNGVGVDIVKIAREYLQEVIKPRIIKDRNAERTNN